MTRAITPSTTMMLRQLVPLATALLAVIVAVVITWEVMW